MLFALNPISSTVTSIWPLLSTRLVKSNRPFNRTFPLSITIRYVMLAKAHVQSTFYHEIVRWKLILLNSFPGSLLCTQRLGQPFKTSWKTRRGKGKRRHSQWILARARSLSAKKNFAFCRCVWRKTLNPFPFARFQNGGVDHFGVNCGRHVCTVFAAAYVVVLFAWLRCANC